MPGEWKKRIILINFHFLFGWYVAIGMGQLCVVLLQGEVVEGDGRRGEATDTAAASSRVACAAFNAKLSLPRPSRPLLFALLLKLPDVRESQSCWNLVGVICKRPRVHQALVRCLV